MQFEINFAKTSIRSETEATIVVSSGEETFEFAATAEALEAYDYPKAWNGVPRYLGRIHCAKGETLASRVCVAMNGPIQMLQK